MRGQSRGERGWPEMFHLSPLGGDELCENDISCSPRLRSRPGWPRSERLVLSNRNYHLVA
jgi:hypothetical protein